MYYSKIKKKNVENIQPFSFKSTSQPSTSTVDFGLTNLKKQEFNLTPTFNLPFILTQAINETSKPLSKLNLSGSLYNDGSCFVIFDKILFIWSIDRPEYCDRIELLDNIKRNHIVIYKNKNHLNDRFSVFVCSPMTGFIKYWGNSSRPNVSQEIPLDSPSGNNFNIYITECSPGVIVGNSLGSIYHVSIKNNNQLFSKKINKPQGMFSYLYLSRQLPVISVATVNSLQQSSLSSLNNNNSNNNNNNNSKFVYVLTEGSLLKYEINNGQEVVVLDYLVHKEIQKQFQDINSIRFHQMYIETIQDQNKDQIELVNIVLYDTVSNSNQVNYYLFQIEIQNEIILKSKRIDNFISNKQIQSGGLKLTEPYFSTDSLKYYLVWSDTIFYYSKNQYLNNQISSGLIKFQNQDIAFSGFFKNQFYFFSEQGIIKLDLYNTSQLQSTSNQMISPQPQYQDMEEDQSSSISAILFDIPSNEEMLYTKRNNVLKWLNLISLKQFDKSDQLFKQFKSYKDLNQIIHQVSIFIVDQQPSSRFWADDGNGKMISSLGTEISVQLKQQLEDKKKRYSFFLKCIHENQLERLLSDDTKESLKRNEILIKLAIELRDYQNHNISKPSILPQLIQDLVIELNPNWNNMGMNIYEIFYSYVSGIDQILISLIKKLQQPSSSRQQPSSSSSSQVTNKVRSLLEGTELFYKAIEIIPVEFLNYSIINKPSKVTCQLLLHDLISILVSFIQSDIKQSSATLILYKKDLGISDLDQQFYNLLFKIIEKYLYSLKINQFDQFNKLKTKIIEPFISFGKFNEAIKLADQFDDYQTYIDVYINEQSNREHGQIKQITDCLNKFESTTTISKIYQYMFDKDLKSELLQLPSKFNDSLSIFLQQYSDLSWIHSIRTKNYLKTSEILYSKSIQLFKQQEQQDQQEQNDDDEMMNDDNNNRDTDIQYNNLLFNEQSTLKEKENYLGIAKISLLASLSDSPLQPNQQKQLNLINQNLSLIKSQKYFLPNIKRILTPYDVISNILKSIDYDNQYQDINYDPLNIYYSCIEIISESNLLLKTQDSDFLLIAILKLSLENEKVFFEKPKSDIQLDINIRDTNFFKVISYPKFPKEIIQTNLHQLIEEYFNSKQNYFINKPPQDKRDFEICITRLLELSKNEINLKN